MFKFSFARFFFILFTGFLLFAPVAGAYLPEVGDVYQKLLRGNLLANRVILYTRSLVFDPFTNGDKKEKNADSLYTGENGEFPPKVLKEKSFTQKLYWVRGKVLMVETFDLSGKLIHLFLDEGFKPVTKSFSPERKFTTMDIISPFMPFLISGQTAIKNGLADWGISPTQVTLVQDLKKEIYYQVDGGTHQNLWVDRIFLRPVRLNTLIADKGSPLKLTLEFSNYFLHIKGKYNREAFSYPGVIDFLLDGKLFKQTVLKNLKVDPSWRFIPLSRIRKQIYQNHKVPGISLQRSEK